MIIILVGDTIDTIYRFILIGYLGDGTTFPGVNSVIKPSTTDLIVFLIIQIGIIYGIYLLYNLKRVGGYWFIVSQILFLIYASILGPIAEIGISNILMPIIVPKPKSSLKNATRTRIVPYPNAFPSPSKNESLTLFCIAKASARPITIQLVIIRAINTLIGLLISYI